MKISGERFEISFIPENDEPESRLDVQSMVHNVHCDRCLQKEMRLQFAPTSLRCSCLDLLITAVALSVMACSAQFLFYSE